MKLTLRMRVTLFTGIVIMSVAGISTATAMYNADNKIQEFGNEVASIATEIKTAELIENWNANLNYDIGIVAPQEITPIQSLEAAYSMPAKKASREFNTISLALMVVITCLGMLVSYYISGKALKPVHELNEAILDISQDNLTKRLSVDNKNDEISALKQSFNLMLDRLEGAFWKQKRFSANVAHELKTPLATMTTGVQVLELSDTPTQEECKEVISIVSKQIQRLTSIVDDLLILTNEGYDEVIESLCLNELFVEIEDELRHMYLSKSIELELKMPLNNCFVSGNRTLIYRLFYNLVENAIKYNVRDGKVQIFMSQIFYQGNDRVCIKIRDTGIGIEKEKLNKIFEPFYCADPSRTRKLGGAGLGLALVKDIVDRYGFKIKVESNKNEGTIFEVEI